MYSSPLFMFCLVMALWVPVQRPALPRKRWTIVGTWSSWPGLRSALWARYMLRSHPGHGLHSAEIPSSQCPCHCAPQGTVSIVRAASIASGCSRCIRRSHHTGDVSKSLCDHGSLLNVVQGQGVGADVETAPESSGSRRVFADTHKCKEGAVIIGCHLLRRSI